MEFKHIQKNEIPVWIKVFKRQGIREEKEIVEKLRQIDNLLDAQGINITDLDKEIFSTHK